MKILSKNFFTAFIVSMIASVSGTQVLDAAHQVVEAGSTVSFVTTPLKVVKESVSMLDKRRDQGYLDLLNSDEQIVPQEPVVKVIVEKKQPKRKKLSAAAVLSAIASMCVHFSALLTASKVKDKNGQTEAIVNMAATALTFATDCFEKEEESTRSFINKKQELQQLTACFLHELKQQNSMTKSVQEKNNASGDTSQLLVSEKKDTCMNEFFIARAFGLQSLEVLSSLAAEVAPESAPAIKDLIAWSTQLDGCSA